MIFKTKSEIDTCSLMVPSLPLHIVLVSKEISNDPPKNSILVALVEKVLTPEGALNSTVGFPQSLTRISRNIEYYSPILSVNC